MGNLVNHKRDMLIVVRTGIGMEELLTVGQGRRSNFIVVGVERSGCLRFIVRLVCRP